MPPYIVLDLKWVWAFTIYYTFGFMWGVAAVVNQQILIVETVGSIYDSFWTAAVALLSGALAILTQTRRAGAESWVTLLWVAIVVVLPIAAIASFAGGDTDRGPASFSTFMYIIFPLARFVYLRLKVRDEKDLTIPTVGSS